MSSRCGDEASRHVEPRGDAGRRGAVLPARHRGAPAGAEGGAGTAGSVAPGGAAPRRTAQPRAAPAGAASSWAKRDCARARFQRRREVTNIN